MPRGDDIRISEIPSARWEMALESLDAGGPLSVLAGEPAVGLQRWTGWPSADGRIHVSIFTTTEPSALTAETSQRETKAGLAHLEAALGADARLAALFERHGIVVAYVYDYGHGAVRVGIVDETGAVKLG